MKFESFINIRTEHFKTLLRLKSEETSRYRFTENVVVGTKKLWKENDI